MNRPKTDELLCFVCQKETPTWKAEKENTETFLLCSLCKSIVEKENYTNNTVNLALTSPDWGWYMHGSRIFTETLGMKPRFLQIRFTKL